MANLVVKSTTNSVQIEANDYASAFGWSKRTRLKSSLVTITLHPDYVEYLVGENGKNYFHYTSNPYNALIVDSIDGNAPTSLMDLYDKIIAVVS
jgi:hypothetical protein